MRMKTAICAIVMVLGGRLARAENFAAPVTGEPAGHSASAREQLTAAREQLGALGMREAPASHGTHRFEGKVPRPMVVLLRTKQPGEGFGSLRIRAEHPNAQGKTAFRESTLEFQTLAGLTEQLQSFKESLAQDETAPAAPRPTCPFSRVLSRLMGKVPANHGVLREGPNGPSTLAAYQDSNGAARKPAW